MTARYGLSRRGFVTGAAAIPLAGCAIPLEPRARTLRLATFNIWHDAEDWAARLPLLVEALRAADADAIALQEVLKDVRKGLPNQAETIAAMLGGFSVHFTSTSPADAQSRYGNAILTRLPILEKADHKLEPLRDYRTALRVRVDANGAPVDIVTTHLAWQPDAAAVRSQQVANLLEWLPRSEAPLVLMGDLNATLDAPELAPLIERFDSALPSGATPTTLNPAKGHADRVIDHILVDRRHLRTIAAHRIGDQAVGGVYPSDHFGVAATVRMS